MTTENQEIQEQPEVNEIEQQAREMGWKPKEEYEGDPTRWVSAEIYVARAPLYEELERRGKETKRLRQDIEVLKQNYSKMEEAAYKRALSSLKEQRKEAILNNELERVVEIDDQIEELKEVKPTQPQVDLSDVQEKVNLWLQENKWYNEDQDLREYADGVGLALGRKNLPPDEVLEQVAQKVKKMFPEKFQKKPSAPKVEMTPSGGKLKPADRVELTEDERKSMRTFVRQGLMTEEQYIEQIKQMRG